MDQRDTNVVKVDETTGSSQAPTQEPASESVAAAMPCSRKGTDKRGHGSGIQIHEHTVNSGEDVAMKIMTLALEKFHAICVLSANGIVSKISICNGISGGISTHEGVFKLHSLNGSFVPTEVGSISRRGQLTVSFKLMDGQLIGGKLAGVLIAAGPVQVKVGSFLPRELLTGKKPKGKNLMDVKDEEDVVAP